MRRFPPRKKTRGESLIEVDKQLLKDYSDPNLTTKPAGLSRAAAHGIQRPRFP